MSQLHAWCGAVTSQPASPLPEAVVVVREAEYRVVLEVLNQLVSGAGGVGLAFSLVQILDSEDWGTADSLRHLRGKLKVCI